MLFMIGINMNIDLQFYLAIGSVVAAWVLSPFFILGTIFLCGLGIGLAATMINK